MIRLTSFSHPLGCDHLLNKRVVNLEGFCIAVIRFFELTTSVLFGQGGELAGVGLVRGAPQQAAEEEHRHRSHAQPVASMSPLL